MKTEEIQRAPRKRDPNEVSRALQELTGSCTLFDRRGRPVPLTSAGYVLRFGQSYRLRVVAPVAGEDVHDVRLLNPPNFLSVEPALREQDEAGHGVHVVPFTVNADRWANLRRLGLAVFGEELEVGHYFKPGVHCDGPPLLCPIVVRPLWTAVVVAVLGSMLLALLEKVIVGLYSSNMEEHLDGIIGSVLRPSFWRWFAVLAVVLLFVVNGANVLALYRRSRTLRGQYRDMYPS